MLHQKLLAAAATHSFHRRQTVCKLEKLRLKPNVNNVFKSCGWLADETNTFQEVIIHHLLFVLHFFLLF